MVRSVANSGASLHTCHSCNCCHASVCWNHESLVLLGVWYFLEFGTTLEPPGDPLNEKGHRLKPMTWYYWSRGADLNHRPSGYEPDELTRLLHPAMYVRRLFTMGKAARKNITLVGRTRQELNLASQNHHMQISATLPQPFSNYFVSPQVGSI